MNKLVYAGLVTASVLLIALAAPQIFGLLSNPMNQVLDALYDPIDSTSPSIPNPNTTSTPYPSTNPPSPPSPTPIQSPTSTPASTVRFHRTKQLEQFCLALLHDSPPPYLVTPILPRIPFKR